MTSRQEFKKMARSKLQEAKTLFEQGYYDGASYLAGYVLEFALKARICKVLDLPGYPESGEFRSFKTHNIDTLFILSGLKRKFAEVRGRNQALLNNWLTITNWQWSESIRYNPIGTIKKQVIEDVIKALEDPKDGVFTWIKKRW